MAAAARDQERKEALCSAELQPQPAVRPNNTIMGVSLWAHLPGMHSSHGPMHVLHQALCCAMQRGRGGVKQACAVGMRWGANIGLGLVLSVLAKAFVAADDETCFRGVPEFLAATPAVHAVCTPVQCCEAAGVLGCCWPHSLPLV